MIVAGRSGILLRAHQNFRRAYIVTRTDPEGGVTRRRPMAVVAISNTYVRQQAVASARIFYPPRCLWLIHHRPFAASGTALAARCYLSCRNLLHLP